MIEFFCSNCSRILESDELDCGEPVCAVCGEEPAFERNVDELRDALTDIIQGAALVDLPILLN